MTSYLAPHYSDLITPDGAITHLQRLDEKRRIATVAIWDIFPGFVGFEIDPSLVIFNMKSTLAQIGLEGISREIHLDRKKSKAEIKVELIAYGDLATQMLELLSLGAYI